MINLNDNDSLRDSLKNSEAANKIKMLTEENLDFHKFLFRKVGLNKFAIPGYVKGGIHTYEGHIIITILKEMSKLLTSGETINILEIGTGTGWSTVCMATASFYLENDVKLKIDTVDISAEFQEKVKKNILIPNNLLNLVNFITMTSSEFFKQNKKSYNFILIDGCHQYEIFKNDLAQSLKCIDNTKANAIFCDDCYKTPKGKKGLDDAIEEFVKENNNDSKSFAFLTDYLFDLHSYPDDQHDVQRMLNKWKKRDYEHWSRDADPKATMFAILNL
jgi:hypothetical protein